MAKAKIKLREYCICMWNGRPNFKVGSRAVRINIRFLLKLENDQPQQTGCLIQCGLLKKNIYCGMSRQIKPISICNSMRAFSEITKKIILYLVLKCGEYCTVDLCLYYMRISTLEHAQILMKRCVLVW